MQLMHRVVLSKCGLMNRTFWNVYLSKTRGSRSELMADGEEPATPVKSVFSLHERDGIWLLNCSGGIGTLYTSPNLLHFKLGFSVSSPCLSVVNL